MSFKDHNMAVSRTALYSTYGTLSKRTRYIWIVCHGYGQLSSKLIQKFDFLDGDRHLVVAPEALSRFYWHKDNEPVASWMTKHDRYNEINDFVNYLDQLYSIYCNHVNQETKIIFMGFSQGCATIWRWIHARQPRFDVLINWAGWIPEDISYLHMADYLSAKNIFVCYGHKDEFLTENVISDLKKLMDKNNIEAQLFPYEGGHRIVREELKQLIYERIGLK